ncbi:MAG: hypothetical protein M1815_006089 [Lichina confinis]|nr:MAG: hypothetical protein M1815_006089 [Lichina confinis]
MVEEESRMEKAALEAEKERSDRFRKDRDDDFKQGDEALDTKFKRLEYLLSQSEVYSSILMTKIKEQRDAAEAAEEQQKQRGEKPEGDTSKSKAGAGTVSRMATRAKPVLPDEAEQVQIAESGRKTGSRDATRKPPNRVGGKKGETLGISDYFQKRSVTTDSGPRRVAVVLEQAADKSATKPAALGAQALRSARQPDLVTGGVMRSYQLEGLEWLTSLYENGLNGILADEMGLGKTIQTISFLAFLRSKKTYGPFLIAAPLSTLNNWVEEFARWTPGIPVVLYHGSKQDREYVRSEKLVQPGSAAFPIVCTSYEICMNDRKYLAGYNWKYIVIDEGHRLKNLNCRLIHELKTYNSANRLLITGTPLQNNLSELWSLLNFLMPEIFDQLEAFESWFDFSALSEKEGHKEILAGERKSHVVSKLHAILKPFLLRRVKADVEASLPKKREYVLYAPLTTAQKDLYRHILEGDSRAYLEQKVLERISAATTPKSISRSASLKRKSGSGASTPNKSVKTSRDSTPANSIRGRTGKKRKDYRERSDAEYFRDLGRDPPSPEEDEGELEELERARSIALAKKEISAKKLQNPVMQLRLACDSPHNFYWPWANDEKPDPSLVTEAGKMLLLERLLPALLKKNHKILIFSQFKTQLDILEDWATLLHGWKVCRIDGQVKSDERRDQIAAFNKDRAYKIFLLSTRAGGQGINLAAADTVILYDSDWNPQQDLQAQDRVHRIGQTRPVIVYRLATKGTIEQTLLDKAEGKRRLEKLVIRKGEFRDLLRTRKKMGRGARRPTNNQATNKNAENADDGVEDDDNDDLQSMLLHDDFEKYDLDDAAVDDPSHLLTDAHLDILTDRSDEAYERAASALQSDGDGARENGTSRAVASEATDKTATNGAAASGSAFKVVDASATTSSILSPFKK